MNWARKRVLGPGTLWGLLIALLIWQDASHAAPSLQIQRLIQMGQHGNASASIRTQLEANPDDADLHALAGTVFSRAGLSADALAPFEFADGSPFYENQGLYAHANALRETGDGAAAAALREERLVSLDLDDSKELVVVLGLVDDYIYLDDMERAYDSLIRLQSIWPRSPTVLGHLVDYYLELGDVEAAEYYLWYVTEVLELKLGMRGLFAQYRLQMHYGNLGAAQAVLDEALTLRKQNHRLRARQAELYRVQGDPLHAVQTLQQKRYWFQEHPEMKAVEALALLESGQIDQFSLLAARLLELYPDHPVLVEVERAMEALED